MEWTTTRFKENDLHVTTGHVSDGGVVVNEYTDMPDKYRFQSFMTAEVEYPIGYGADMLTSMKDLLAKLKGYQADTLPNAIAELEKTILETEREQ